MEIQTVSRKQRQKTMQAKEEVTTETQPVARRQTFIAPPCKSCEQFRKDDPKAAGRNYSRVVSTQGRFRYCKCDYCNRTWKEIGDSFTGNVKQ